MVVLGVVEEDRDDTYWCENQYRIKRMQSNC